MSTASVSPRPSTVTIHASAPPSVASAPIGSIVRPATAPGRSISAQASAARPSTAAACATGTTTGDTSSAFVVALAEGRGVASEIGLAAIDLRTSECILSQFGDTPTHARTLHRLALLSPVQIVVCQSTVDPAPSRLFAAVDAAMTTADIVALPRKLFNDVAGLATVRELGLQDHTEMLVPGLASKSYCLSAVAALIKYIESNQSIVFTAHSLKFKYQTCDGTMTIDPVTARALELVWSLSSRKSPLSLFGVFSKHMQTTMGYRLLRMSILQPLTDTVALEARLDAVQELVDDSHRLSTIHHALEGMLDVDHLISSLVQVCRKPTVKHAEQAINTIIILKHVLGQAEVVASALDGCESLLLQSVRTALNAPSLTSIMTEISNVVNEDVAYQRTAIGLRNQRCFAVRSGVNGLLDVARQTYREACDDVYNLVNSYSERFGKPIKVVYTPALGFHMSLANDVVGSSNMLPDFVNIINRRKQVTFTTLKLMGQNDRIQESLTEVYVMSDAIISDLMDTVRGFVSALYQVSESVEILDMMCAFAAAAKDSAGVRPEYTETLAIKNGRHPIMDTMKKVVVVPNDTFADASSRIQMISGPNMSGKSTYIRQIALVCVMAQMGAYVPAEYASIRIMDHLFSRIGTDDSLEANASTFMLEMTEMSFILSNLTDRSLVVIDELGRGTSTSDGVGVCVAICEELILKQGAVVFLVTHFDELAVAFADTPTVVSLHLQAVTPSGGSGRLTSVDADGCDGMRWTGLSFTYKVRPGSTGMAHYGLQVAAMAGMDGDLLERARAVSVLVQKRRKALGAANAACREAAKSRERLRIARALVQLHGSSRSSSGSADAHLRRSLVHALIGQAKAAGLF